MGDCRIGTADRVGMQIAVEERPDPGDGRGGEGVPSEAAMRREDGDDLAEIRSDQGFSDRLVSSRLRKYGHQRRARKRQRQCQDARIGSSECQLAREVTSICHFSSPSDDPRSVRTEEAADCRAEALSATRHLGQNRRSPSRGVSRALVRTITRSGRRGELHGVTRSGR